MNGAFVLVYSNALLRRDCPPKDDAPVVSAKDTIPQKRRDAPDRFLDDQIVPDHCGSSPRGMQFDKIYANGKWFKGKSLRHPREFYSDAEWPPREIQRRSASGIGSDRGYPTVTSLKVIKDAIAKFNARSMIDIPCGDVNWIFDSWETDALPLYIGLDISFSVVAVNRERFRHHRNKQFHVWDATECSLPRFQIGNGRVQPVDLVHVRDVIQHMTLKQGVKYFCSVFLSGAKALITTTFEDGVNRDIREGGFYQNNLMAEPFSFPRGNCTATHPNHEKDFTCVYNLTEGWVQEFMASKC